MLSEHIFYSGAIAILIGMVFYRLTGRDSSWIIILCAWAPDLDLFLDHGAFHNIAGMLIFGIVIAFILTLFGIKFFDAFVFSVIGFGVHLLEDAMVFDVSYPFLWPFSTNNHGLELFPNVISPRGHYIADFFRIANTEILLAGLLCLLLAIIIRTFIEGPTWIRWYMPESLYLKISGIFDLEDYRKFQNR
jgi:LexA-binding, inner membrane-associated putative hydrolase